MNSPDKASLLKMERLMANVGTIDRGIRLVIGIAAIAAVFVGPFAGAGWERIALGAVGIIMIVTSSIRDDAVD